MKVVYASCAVSKLRFSETFADPGRMPGQQVQKYHRLMLAGFAANGVQVVAVPAPPITSSNTDRLVARLAPDEDEGVEYRYLAIVNVPLIKNVLVMISCFLATARVLSRERDAIVVCDVLNFSVATGALLAAKIFGRPSVGLVTDLPKYVGRAAGRVRTGLIESVMGKYSHYVFLTELMNSVVNPRGVPFVVIEGQVDAGMATVTNALEDKHASTVCLYAGAVDRRYGLPALVEGFLLAAQPNCELHIYGGGDYAAELQRICVHHQEVRYFGVVPNQIVVEEELRATLLVNPRPTEEEFVKYSFPSKNMEYMASGTPVLTTKLPGMPESYYPYVYVINDESARGIGAALRATLSRSRSELHELGEAAKEFVLQSKGNNVQAKRVLQMVHG